MDNFLHQETNTWTPVYLLQPSLHLYLPGNGETHPNTRKTKMNVNPARAEAERLLVIAENLLQNRDLHGSRGFAILAQETEPLLDGSDQILAVIDVLLAAEKRVNNHHDWYAILQVGVHSGDLDFIKKQYRRLAILLHPDKNRLVFSDHAFKLVAEAWAVLSDPGKKYLYDREIGLASRVDLTGPGWAQQDGTPFRRDGPSGLHPPGFDFRSSGNGTVRDDPVATAGEDVRMRSSTFWTACPYCYLIYEYPKVYEDCCLKCQNCERCFHGVVIPSLPPLVPGQEAYFSCWGFFPMGFDLGKFNSDGKRAPPPMIFPSWLPRIFSEGHHVETNGQPPAVATSDTPVMATPLNVSNGIASNFGSQQRKRGRPRKAPL